ncbi:MAG: (1-_4)-alpha-D-glucan 1-alpha-D-glucosylmutase [Chthoniobacter sp.]|jgi:(1->4)-alpha-D-glucan 1-alpha-D-glucosylmutase|nr:(1->4)-alpha-D-glucan 1-alpha-D-glucosylmutase [Chthoniobacter sp.]
MTTSIPHATYRLQFHQGFTFQAARTLVPYLHALGVSHVYASPFFRAAAGSMHGYDVCDHNELNPEVGSRADFDAFVAELDRHEMGLIADFVPNHMGIGELQNAWWLDVLENGAASPYARFFDIDWQPLKRELENKVLLPILGDQYGRVLERGEFRLQFASGTFSLTYSGLRLPLAPRSIRPVLHRAAELLVKPPAELESILTALEHLPHRNETDLEKLTERLREKQIIRERLARLCSENAAVEEAILGAIAEFNDNTNPASFDRLDALINDQPYRLSFWRVAAEEINYRRFFDINSLAAIRMELPEVFADTHRLLLELIASGAVKGVRIDHIDGLSDPRAYLRTLQERSAEALQRGPDPKAIYLLVEKILAPGERLRADWPIHGTTGYEFGNQVTAVLLDAEAKRAMTDCYSRFIGLKLDFREVAYRSKRLVMQLSMASEVNSLGHMLNRLSESNRWYRDFTVNALITAVREVIACFPVYRSYLVPGCPPDEHDSRLVNRAIAQARRRNPALERTVFEFLRDVLLPAERNAHPVDEEIRSAFVLKFQQCTGPITAKGVEDTSFYVYNRLVALNEVGGEPGDFGGTTEHFHRQNASRLADFPHSLLATSTHDTKRSEDVRARIAALSEEPQNWSHSVRRWRTANRKHKREIEGESAPDSNEEFLIYQTLVGSWPLTPLDHAGRENYVQRIQDYMVKALHEAKVNSSWIEPNEAWDNAVRNFVAKILQPEPGNRFLPAFELYAEQIAQLGAINSLSQTVLKLTSPGVPDLYQGTELWDLSLVDPDNRRPVDYDLRRAHLASLEAGASPAELLETWGDGRIKLRLIQAVLRFRREHPSLFAAGSYEGVASSGAFAQCCVAFERKAGSENLLVVVPRLSSRVGFPATGERWQDTTVAPSTVQGAWVDVVTGREHTAAPALRLAELFGELPAAVLARRV